MQLKFYAYIDDFVYEVNEMLNTLISHNRLAMTAAERFSARILISVTSNLQAFVIFLGICIKQWFQVRKTSVAEMQSLTMANVSGTVSHLVNISLKQLNACITISCEAETKWTVFVKPNRQDSAKLKN